MAEAAGGQWLALERPLYMLESPTCCTCGEMIPGSYWDGGGGLARPYCSPECQVLEQRVQALRARWSAGEQPFASLAEG